jgi:hypothetical protein
MHQHPRLERRTHEDAVVECQRDTDTHVDPLRARE